MPYYKDFPIRLKIVLTKEEDTKLDSIQIFAEVPTVDETRVQQAEELLRTLFKNQKITANNSSIKKSLQSHSGQLPMEQSTTLLTHVFKTLAPFLSNLIE